MELIHYLFALLVVYTSYGNCELFVSFQSGRERIGLPYSDDTTLTQAHPGWK